MAMTEEERKEYNKEYNKKYRKERKEEIRKIKEKYYKKHKEEIRERQREYNKNHREELKEYRIKYNKKHKEEIRERQREYVRKYRKTHEKELKERYKKHKFYDSIMINEIITKYFRKEFARFISILGYFTIMKTPNESLRRSIMTKLGMGVIDEQEAIRLSGQVLTQEDLDLINSYVSQYKGKVS